MTLEKANIETLQYELSRIEKAIESVSKLLEKYSNKPAQFEYYHTMQECLLALDAALSETRQIQRTHRGLSARLELLETLFNDWRKTQ